MKEFIIYLIKSGLCVSIFLLIYKLFMRSTTFFKFNRIFLICGLVIALIIPTISYTYDVVKVSTSTVMPQDIERLASTPTLSKVSEVDVDYNQEEPVVTVKKVNAFLINLDYVWTAIFALYLLVVLLLIVRNIMAHINLWKLYKNSPKIEFEGYRVVDSSSINSPFTLFGVIFADMSKISDDEKVKNSILKHELVHIRQLHWVDLIISELSLILQWFNPAMWIYVKYQKCNHEYLADKGVLEDDGISPEEYKAVLVNEQIGEKIISLASSFKNSSSLSRLAMMGKEKTSAWRKALMLMIVPLLGAFLWVSAEPNYILIDFDNISLKVMDDITTVDEDGYLIENGFSTRDMMFFTQLSGYESLVPSSLRSNRINVYSKTGKDGTLVIKTQSNSNEINNRELIQRLSNLEDMVIIIDGEASTIDKLNEISTKDIASLSYLNDGKMVTQNKDQITMTFITSASGNPKIIKTDNLDIIRCNSLNDLLNMFSKPEVIINGKKSTVEELKSINMNKVNIFSIYTKNKMTSKYGANAQQNGVIIVSANLPS